MTLIRKGTLLGTTTRVEPIYDVSDEWMDILAVKLRGIIFVNVYIRVMGSRRPDNVLDAFMDHLASIIEDRASLPIVVGGDFNCPKDPELLIELMAAARFRPVYDRSGRPSPTHSLGGILDWVFIRGQLDASPLQSEIRGDDHAVIRTTVQTIIDVEPSRPSIRYNWKLFNEFTEEERTKFFAARDLIAAQAQDLSEFRDGITCLLQTELGEIKPRGASLPKRWLTPQVNKARRAFKCANRQYHRHPNPESQQAMRTARASYIKAIRKRKRNAVAQLASQVDLGLSSIHRLVGSVKKDPKHQSRLVPDLAKTIEFWTDQFEDDDALDPELLGSDTGLTFSPSEVATALKQMDPKKATGEDDIRPKVFDSPTEALLKDLARLYTDEAQRGSPLPEWMKTGNANVLYKHKGPKADPGNYRVIIINSFLAKLYEKMLETHGRNLIAQGILNISVEQGGFMPGRSTHDSLFMLESLRDAQVARKRKLYAAFLDMRKAFDSVNHKRFIALLRESGAPEEWTTQLIKMLAGRQMKLFDALISLEVGTAQGSPISPLLFILFINPLIERLRACKGVQFAIRGGVFIRDLLFADDICLVAETVEDLQDMLDVCHKWTEEFQMRFNPAKCELIQLAGKPTSPPPECRLDGIPLKWVKEVKYLGVPFVQGRRHKLHAPISKMWQTYHCIRDALSSTLPVSIKHQLALIQTNLLSIALYPSAVRDMHYEEIDRFVNRCLCRIVGCPQRWTSATFLRAELGMYSSKYYAHRRALGHLWHLHNQAWFRNHLGDLQGKGPLKRLQELARSYELDISDIKTVSKESWKARIKRVTTDLAEKTLNTTLTTKGMPIEVKPGCKRRDYIDRGGPSARAGLQLRWELLHHHHTSPNHSVHRPSLPGLLQKLLNGPLPTTTEALRNKSLRAIARELSGVTEPSAELPAWVQPHVTDAVRCLSWPGMTSDTLRDLLKVVERVIRWTKREQELASGASPSPNSAPRYHQSTASAPPTPARAG